MEEISAPWKTVKGTWNNSLLKKIKKFWGNGIMKLPEKWQKVLEQNGEYVVSKKFLVKMKHVSFIFTLKTKQSS